MYLMEVYRRYAEEFERKADTAGNREMAASYYEKCQQAAAACGELRSEGAATYRLGVCAAVLGQKKQAIAHQQRYMDICRQLGDTQGEGAACAALASGFQDEGDTALAVK
jgi:hypothetical protein